MKRNHRVAVLAALAVAGLGLSACVDKETVYVEGPRFQEPPAGAAGFLGYSKEEKKLTVCGNCHVGQQAEWENTAHASAWEGLQASGHAAPYCEDCHVVSGLGNAVAYDQKVAWSATKDERYHDVQCESCHGPGLDHVTNPDATVPLAPIAVAADLDTGCGECHRDTHHPFVEEWSASRHATSAASGHGESCDPCHNAGGALAAFGVKDNYLEKGTGEEMHLGIVCSVCHDPHDGTEMGQLRFAIDVPSVEENLCMKCHHKRGTPDPTSSRGPHSPEGPLLLGEGGWWPPNMNYDPGSIVGTHGSEANPRLCAGCHVIAYEVTDAQGGFVIGATGHSFQAIPCLDDQGKPLPGSVDCDLSQRSFKSCTAGGCHGSEAAARSAMVVAEQRIATLNAELKRLLAQVPADQFATDATYTTAEGAQFNSELADMTGSAIHNPFLVEALLAASIQQLKADYGVAVKPGISLELQLNSR